MTSPRRRTVSVVLLALAVAATGVALFVATAGPATAKEFATLHPLEGTVEVGRGGGSFRPGTDGMSLKAGDVVRTGEDGRARIAYFDGSETRLDFNTTFRLVELTSLPDTESGKIIEADQDGGRTFQRVREITDSESRVDVGAPTAVASVRGTLYSWWVRPDSTTVLWVLPDDEPGISVVVVVLEDGTEIEVPEGHGLVILPNGRAGDVYELNEFELNDPWVLFNLCDLDQLDLEACQQEEAPEEEAEEQQEEEGEGDGGLPSFVVTPVSAPEPTVDLPGDSSIDTAAPDARISAGPGDPSRDPSPGFAFSSNEAGSTFECGLDGRPYRRCSSPLRYHGLEDGRHRFRVRAIDRAGNVGPADAHSWRLDTDPPETTITSGPGCAPSECEFFSAREAGPRAMGGPVRIDFTFEFVADEPGARFRCSLDGGGFERCSSPHEASVLAFESHRFRVRAIDEAGNADPTPDERLWFAGGCEICLQDEGSDRRRGPGPVTVGPATGDPVPEAPSDEAPAPPSEPAAPPEEQEVPPEASEEEPEPTPPLGDDGGVPDDPPLAIHEAGA